MENSITVTLVFTALVVVILGTTLAAPARAALLNGAEIGTGSQNQFLPDYSHNVHKGGGIHITNPFCTHNCGSDKSKEYNAAPSSSDNNNPDNNSQK